MKKIAILSGKGGTGKTSLSASLILAFCDRTKVTALDCDVESPNLNLLMKGQEVRSPEMVFVDYPRINEEKCNFCGRCARVCNFNAIVIMKKQKKTMIWDDLCHSCGACLELCPEKAIEMKPFSVGEVRFNQFQDTQIVTGESDIGKMMPDPVISKVLSYASDEGINIIDSPPGTSCPVVKSAVTADHAILVAEPSPFGIHDMKLAMELLEELKVKYSIVINKSSGNDSEIEKIAANSDVAILGTIPFDLKGAEYYSRGEIERYYEYFKVQIDQIAEMLAKVLDL